MNDELSDELLKSLFEIHQQGVEEAMSPLGHIVLLNDLGYIENDGEVGSYVSSMQLTEAGIRKLKSKFNL